MTAATPKTDKTERGYVLPTWSKILIGVVVLTLTGLFALGMAGIFEVKKVATRMEDQKAIAAAAAQIAAFPDPLPKGYRYVTGIALDPVEISVVTILHEPDKQLLTFIKSRNAANDDTKEVLDNSYNIGLVMICTNAKFTDIEKKGVLKVGSYDIPYIMGHAEDVMQERGEGMVACLQVGKKGAKNILIYALQTGKVPYNQQITMDLLNSIKSF